MSAARRSSWAIVAGAAGIGYVVAAGIENMDVLRRPLPGAGAGDVHVAYADQALAAATALAGVLSLLFYIAFATTLALRLRRPVPALAAALAGSGLAFGAIVVSAPLVLGADLPDDAVLASFELQRVLRMAAGPAMAVVLLSLARGRGVLPRPLARSALVLAVPLALTPLAAVLDARGVQVAAGIVLGLHLAWIWLAGLWLTVGRGERAAVMVRRAAFLMLAVAAGLVGVALLALPGHTGTYFAWELEPAPLARFAGGAYVGSAVLYAAALHAPWRQARALVAAAVVLSVSVLAITLTHLEPFDLDRLQAWAWLVLFAGFALVTCALLLAGDAMAPTGAARLPAWVRGLLATIAVVLAELGVVLWIDPSTLPPLGGRFAGSWAMMLAVLIGWAAAVNRRDEARLPALGLVLLPAGALAGALLTPGAEPVHLGGLAVLAASGAAVLHATRPERAAVAAPETLASVAA